MSDEYSKLLKTDTPSAIKSRYNREISRHKKRFSKSNIKSGILDKLTFFLDIRLIAFLYALLSAIYFYKLLVNRNVDTSNKEEMDSFTKKQKILYIYIFTTLGVIIILNIIKHFVKVPIVLVIIIIVACILCITPIATLIGLILKSDADKK